MVSLRLLASLSLGCALAACAPRVPFGDDRSPVTEGGAPAVGSPSPTLGNLAPKSAVNLGRYECDDLPGSGHPCQTIHDYSRFVYDRAGQQLLWFGGGSHATARTDVTVFGLDTLRWQSAYESTACAEMQPGNADLVRGAWSSTGHPMSRQTFDMLVMADNAGELVMLTYNTPAHDCGAWPADAPDLEQVPGRVAHYWPAARSWRYTEVPANTWQADAAAEYDPESGLILVLGSQDLWTYDPLGEVAEHRLHFELGERFGYGAELVYFPPTGHFYYFTRAGLVFEIAPQRGDWPSTSITEITDLSGALPAAEAKGWAYDSARQTIAGGVRDSVFWELDLTSHIWTATPVAGADGELPGSLGFFTLDYAEQAGVFVFFTDYPSGWATWVYRN